MNKFVALCNVRRLFDIRGFSIRITADGKDIPKKKVIESRITLIGPDNSVSITDLKNAQSLSLRRDLKLVKVQDEDSKTRRPIYRLMTNAEYHQEELSKRKEKQATRSNALKGQKLLTLTSKIAEHDVMVNVNKIKKLLEKQYEVKIVISGSEEDNQNFERIYSIIEKNVNNGKVLQKRNKGSSLRFQFLPVNNVHTKTDSSNDNNNDKGPL
ncbi:translation initiation factor IF-3, mitochondrial [Epargyreus clarus]|uniref:translation initiation factor IF-3, mitochondrial n=1 Tax=Epargyreus clarus TaxID=520877 RepID=UPI003C2AB21B